MAQVPSLPNIKLNVVSTTPSPSETAAGVARQSTQPPPPILNNRERLNQRLQKYRLHAYFDIKCYGPQHAQRWRCFCYVGKLFVGCSNWHSTIDAAKEEADGRALEWFDKYGYP
jgi:hypothetical protein